LKSQKCKNIERLMLLEKEVLVMLCL